MYICDIYAYICSNFPLSEISNFISRFLVAPESKAAAAAVAETDSAAVAAEVDNPDLITTQSVSYLYLLCKLSLS